MMAVMAVISPMPVIPGVSRARVIVRIRLGIRVVWPLVIPVRIIIIARWIGITIAGKPKTESANAGKSGGDLSVSTLPSNESQSAYRQSNQEKFFHRIFLFCLFPSCLSFCEESGCGASLYRGIGYRRSRGSLKGIRNRGGSQCDQRSEISRRESIPTKGLDRDDLN